MRRDFNDNTHNAYISSFTIHVNNIVNHYLYTMVKKKKRVSRYTHKYFIKYNVGYT